MTAATLAADLNLPTVDLNDPGYLADPHGTWAHLRGQHWLARCAAGYCVTRHADVEALIRSPKLGAGGGSIAEIQGIHSGPIYEFMHEGLLSAMDGAVHARLRRLMSRAFTAQAVQRHRTDAREVAERLVATMAAAGTDGGRHDFIESFAQRFPIEVFCRMAGIPVDDIPVFTAWVREVGLAFVHPVEPVKDRAEAAILNLFEYSGELISRRRAEPGDDLLSMLVQTSAEDGDRLSARELQWQVVDLTFAGQDTTQNQVPLTVRMLVEHPGAWAELAANPALAATAVEEGMRLHPVVPTGLRRVLTDFTYRDVLFPAGTQLLLRADSANRDPYVFPDPDRCDLHRTNSHRQMVFGGGAHHCLGAALARLEMTEALPVLARAFPDLGIGEAVWRPYSSIIIGPERMPVTLGAGAAR